MIFNLNEVQIKEKIKMQSRIKQVLIPIAYLPVFQDTNRKVISYDNVSVTDYTRYYSNVTKSADSQEQISRIVIFFDINIIKHFLN